MGVLKEIHEKVEGNLNVIRKCFKEVLSGFELKEKYLTDTQESVATSVKELDVMREAIEARVKEVGEREKVFHLFMEKGLKEMEMKRKEMILIQEDIKVREQKLNEQEKLIKGLLEKVELEGKHIGDIRNSIDESYRKIYLKERLLVEYRSELDLIKKIDCRPIELDKKEERLEGLVKEIELRENMLVSKQQELVAKENELEVREKILELTKELRLKERELDFIKESKEQCYDSINPLPSWKGRKRSRKRCRNSGVESSGHVEKNSNRSDGNVTGAAHSHSARDLSEQDPNSAHQDSASGGIDEEGIAGDDVSDSYSGLGDVSNSNFDNPEIWFNYFEYDRAQMFRAGQIWACSYYDRVDDMPRSYFRVQKVRHPIVRVEWLQPVPHYFGPRACCSKSKRSGLYTRDYGWKEWIDAGLPVVCGGFGYQNAGALSLSLYRFSDRVCFREEPCHRYLIHPSKGEIWAIYKDWNI